MRRPSSRLLLMTLGTLLVSGCHSFTLVGSVNLGSESAQPPADDKADQKGSNVEACWPSSKAAFNEMVAHGFTPKKWPKTEAWFAALGPVSKVHPTCPEVKP